MMNLFGPPSLGASYFPAKPALSRWASAPLGGTWRTSCARGAARRRAGLSCRWTVPQPRCPIRRTLMLILGKRAQKRRCRTQVTCGCERSRLVIPACYNREDAIHGTHCGIRTLPLSVKLRRGYGRRVGSENRGHWPLLPPGIAHCDPELRETSRKPRNKLLPISSPNGGAACNNCK